MRSLMAIIVTALAFSSAHAASTEQYVCMQVSQQTGAVLLGNPFSIKLIPNQDGSTSYILIQQSPSPGAEAQVIEQASAGDHPYLMKFAKTGWYLRAFPGEVLIWNDKMAGACIAQ